MDEGLKPTMRSTVEYAEDVSRAARTTGTDDRVSELDGALQFVDAMLEENARAVMALRERLTPVMQGERASDPHALAAAVDPRSDVVRKITEYGERLRDHTNLVKDALERLDV